MIEEWIDCQVHGVKPAVCAGCFQTKVRQALELALKQEGWHVTTGPVLPAWVSLAHEALGIPAPKATGGEEEP